MAHTPEPLAITPIRRLQLIAITLVGLLAVLAFLLSLAISGETGQTLHSVAGGLGILCAVIGVSFAVVGNRR
jgi:succinate-acetate transporter protein